MPQPEDPSLDRGFFLDAFEGAARLAEPGYDYSGIEFRYCAEHRIGTLEKGRSFVYIFYQPAGRSFLKIGKAGPKSQPRIYQHYHPDSSQSNLAASLLADPEYAQKIKPASDVADWIRANTRLFLLILPDDDRFLRNLLEAFLHLKLKPVFEKG
jgi:hypothetical protein